MNLFIFFALPLATILLSIVFQKLLRSPILVAITVFAIFLIVAFAAFAGTLAEALIATIIYTIIAFITALLTDIICNFLKKIRCCCRNNCLRCELNNYDNNCNQHRECENNGCCQDNDNVANDLLTISCNCGGGETSDLLTVSSNCMAGNLNSNNRSIVEGNNTLRSPTRMTRRTFRRF